ncbi:MFS transporter [Patescibacteria group bacterium]|nr:MFS transporter [Patescibacteria group bacterium]
MENVTKNALIMGMILSASSVCGIFIDFIIAKFFGKRSYVFFMLWMIIFAALFPFVLLTVPPNMVFILLSMLVWSLYYELRGYSDFSFIHRFMPMGKHTLACSVIATVVSLAYTLGPILAVFLIEKHFDFSFIASIITTGLSFVLFVMFFWKNKKRRNLPATEHKEKTSFIKEIKVLGVLFQKIKILLLFQFALMLCDAAFWTTGILFANKLKEVNEIAAFIPSAYTLPSIFVGTLASLVKTPMGKKRGAFASGVVGACAISLIAFTQNVPIIIVLVLIAAVTMQLACIYIYSTFTDYVERLDILGNDITTLTQLAANMAYIVGPIALGYIAVKINYGATFGFAGIFLLLVTFFAMTVTPRKIRMPQAELKALK